MGNLTKISFIVVGKNEGRHLFKCISSINETIKTNLIKESQVIYVDSDSADDSIDIVNSFKNVEVYKISGKINAALARNIGAQKSRGNILVFIDGDMQLLPNNFHNFFLKDGSLENEYVTGDFINLFYEDGRLINKQHYYNFKKDSYRTSMGGLFLIKKELWEKNRGMRTAFKRSQDIDFALRISKYKKILQKTVPLALHHTVRYNHLKRFNKDFLSGNFFYRVLLIKYNILNKFILKRIFLEFTSIVLFTTIIIMFVAQDPIYLFLYLLSISMKIIYKNRLKSILRYFYVYSIVDICNLLSIFFFWPKNIKNEEYSLTKILKNS